MSRPLGEGGYPAPLGGALFPNNIPGIARLAVSYAFAVVLPHSAVQTRTNQTQDARVCSHDGPIRRRMLGYILTTDQSDGATPSICLLPPNNSRLATQLYHRPPRRGGKWVTTVTVCALPRVRRGSDRVTKTFVSRGTDGHPPRRCAREPRPWGPPRVAPRVAP
eukprot:856961-Prorocentrum_minimum.AAC.1